MKVLVNYTITNIQLQQVNDYKIERNAKYGNENWS